MAEEIKQEIAEVEDDDKEFERINKNATDILSSFITAGTILNDTI